MNAGPVDHRPLLVKLAAVVVVMAAFTFALVPLYDVFCDWTGLNGKPAAEAASYQGVSVDEQRLVTVEFIASKGGDMPWQFRPLVSQVQVHPGALTQVSFAVVNPTSRAMVGQAVPSVAPGQAAAYLHKTECFCFNQQPLAAGERQQLGLLFYVDPELPAGIHTLTLSYTLFDISAPATAVASR